jgi:hypothetical protein
MYVYVCVCLFVYLSDIGMECHYKLTNQKWTGVQFEASRRVGGREGGREEGGSGEGMGEREERGERERICKS